MTFNFNWRQLVKYLCGYFKIIHKQLIDLTYYWNRTMQIYSAFWFLYKQQDLKAIGYYLDYYHMYIEGYGQYACLHIG